MSNKKDLYKLGEETKEFRANEINISEEKDYYKWLDELSLNKGKPLKRKGMIKVSNFDLSKGEKLISLLTYNIMNQMGSGDFSEISSAAYALVPLYRDILNAEQGGDKWLKKDILFNTVPGTTALTNLFDFLLGNIDSAKVTEYQQLLRGGDAIEAAIGVAIARSMLDWSQPGVINGNIYIYIKAEQLLTANVYESMGIISRNRLKNIIFIISANEDISKIDYNRMLRTLANNGILYREHQGHVSVTSNLKKLSLVKNPSALIIKSRKSFDTHWSNNEIKSKTVTDKDLKYLKNKFGYNDINYDDLNAVLEVSEFRKVVRKRIIDSYQTWVDQVDKKGKKIILDKINNSWKVPKKSQLTNAIDYKKDRNLDEINEKFINLLKKHNPELIINNSSPGLSASISNGISSYGLRSIIKANLLTSEALMNQLRISEKRSNGIIVNLFYNRERIVGMRTSSVIQSLQNSFKNVYTPANATELVEAWTLALKKRKEIHIIIIDEASIFNIKPVSKNIVGKFNDGGYIIKKRIKPTKPVDYIFYGSGTIINEVAEVAKEIELEGKLNIQVVSVPFASAMKNETQRKILPKTIKTVEFISTGRIEKSHLKLVNKKYAKAFITPNTWRTKNYIKEIRNILGE